MMSNQFLIVRKLHTLFNIIKYKIKLLSIRRYKLNKKDFTIISDNCLAGSIYKDLNLPFNTPTIGMFICGPDYIKLVYDLEYYLSLPFEEKSFSDHVKKVNYPLAKLGDVELHLLHYSSFEQAKEKWERRVKRVNYKNLCFTMTDRDYTTYDNLISFNKLQRKKIVFTSKKYEELNCSVWCDKYKHEKTIGFITLLGEYLNYINIVEWLNESYNINDK